MNEMGESEMNSTGPGQGPVVRSYEYGTKLSGFIKGREFLDQLNKSLASQEGLCPMKLVSYLDSTS
jgi:hypothetical protein